VVRTPHQTDEYAMRFDRKKVHAPMGAPTDNAMERR